MFLLDTDILSALRRRDRHPELVQWITQQRADCLYLSVITIGEIERGITAQHGKNPEFAALLAQWLGQLQAVYGDRILAVDLETAKRWGRLSAAIGNPSADLMIAASALTHGLSVVTRNVRHFTPTGVPVINPFHGP